MEKYKKKYEISVVVTYYNESHNIKKTIEQLIKQSYKPSEIIFINSDSTDKTFEIIQKKISYLSKKYNIKNYSNLKSSYPSTSKNLGIQLAKCQFIAFMDCGLKFSKNWLKNKIQLLHKNNLEVILGTCKLSGHNTFDKACVANTYGINKKNICIPGSIIKKSVFLKIGYFEASRSFYDVIWKEKLNNSKILFAIDYQNYVEYDGINYAKNVSSLFKKSSLYSQDVLNIKKNTQTKYYIILPWLLLFFFLINFYLFIVAVCLYFATRLIFAKIKSYKYLSLINFKLIFQISTTGLIIDLGRVLGSYKSLLNYLGINSVLSFVFLIYFIFFLTPFMSIFSSNLMNHKNELQFEQANAIVVFSGDGNVNYNNETYKERALEAVQYSNLSQIEKIFLSSGREQTIDDVDLLKLFLISNNANPKHIYIFDKYPNSTFANVLMVGDELLKNNYKNIIFLTTPIHNKRSVLTWKKNFPEINIYIPEVKKKIKWKFSLDEILIIFYEYVAIIANYFQGRL